MTSHDTYREQLLDLAYGELGRREARALRAHLESCAECRAELARMTATRSAMSALRDEPAPDRGEGILLAAAREAVRERRPRPFLPSWVWGASVGVVGAAAVALLAVRLAGAVKSPVSEPAATELISRSAPAQATEPPPAAQPGPEQADHEAPGGVTTGVEARPAPSPIPGAKAAPDEPTPKATRSLAGPEKQAASEPAPLAKGKKASPAPARDAPPAGSAKEVPSAPAPAARPAAPAEAAPAAAPPAMRRLEAEQDAVASADEESQAAQPRGRIAGERKQVGRSGPEDAIARHDRLQAAGVLHLASASFPDCPGESSRAVAQDEQGRIVKLTRRGVLGGTPFVVEQFYGEDGALGAVRYHAGGAVHELRFGGPGSAAASTAAGIPVSALEPRRATEAGLDAPPRCEE